MTLDLEGLMYPADRARDRRATMRGRSDDAGLAAKITVLRLDDIPAPFGICFGKRRATFSSTAGR
ncbi:hypothetical protein EAS62_38830 [Bradyrhizobium zhanjiangense]|uniref:Uncharacterized protein n=1 Tax=Bradyrhizobium zhanjiangense TaxID=1325107 RepID=A0ABY0D8U7_9BRAD|nr:hypothetical protein EAS62_38830 [Bradyrhizobium zhanjiangense]